MAWSKSSINKASEKCRKRASFAVWCANEHYRILNLAEKNMARSNGKTMGAFATFQGLLFVFSKGCTAVGTNRYKRILNNHPMKPNTEGNIRYDLDPIVL